MKHRLPLTTGLATIVFLATNMIGASAGDHVRLTDQAAAITAFEHAMSARQTINSVPSSGRVSDAAYLRELGSERETTLRRLFGGAQLEAEARALRAALGLIAGGNFRPVGGSADAFSFSSVKSVSADKVQLTEAFVAHSTMYEKDGRGTWVRETPSNKLNFSATVERFSSSGPWRVTAFDSDFAPGSEP